MECVNISGYFQQLEQLLDCPGSLRRSFVHQTQRMAEDFVQGRPDATQEELVDYLGEPQELAQGFLETLDPDVLERYRKRKKFLLRGCIVALVGILAIVVSWGIHLKLEPKTVEVTEVIKIYD